MRLYNTTEVTVPNIRRVKLFMPVTISYLVLCVLFMIFSDFTNKFIPYMVLSFDNITDGRIWTLFTYTFVGGCCIFPFVFNLVVFFLLGSYIESQWKSLPFLLFIIIISVLSGIVWIMLTPIFRSSEAPEFGTPCIGYAMMVVYGLMRRDKLVMIPGGAMNLLHFMLGLLVISALLTITIPLYLITFCGALWGYLYMVVLKKISIKRANATFSAPQGRGNRFVDID